jgi:hypothetical protein
MLVQSKISTCIEGFLYNFAQIFIIVRRSEAHKIQVPATKVKVIHRGKISDKNTKICIGTILLATIVAHIVT